MMWADMSERSETANPVAEATPKAPVHDEGEQSEQTGQAEQIGKSEQSEQSEKSEQTGQTGQSGKSKQTKQTRQSGRSKPEGRAEERSSREPPARSRYAIREDETGPYLTCTEAPNVAVRIERGLSVSSAAAKKAPQGTIYLDGAAADEPFMDVQRRVYNLDHHEGCVRPFTLATCEQAIVMVLKGLDLKNGEWNVWANEPDLDTVLAIWVLLNHMRLSPDDSEIRRAVMPLIRLEGAIDANGLRFAELCGFTEEQLKKTKATLDDFHSMEMEVKQSGRWSSVDFHDFTSRVLTAIDTEYYPPDLFEEAPDIEEIQRVQLTDQRMAVICQSDNGIYEVEKGLLKLHGNTVGVIILQKNPRTYTLRQVDPFLPISLQALYDRLNLIDPSVQDGGEANRWGGSAEIGGSPRKTGTALTLNEIASICRWVYQPPTRWKRLSAAAGAVGLAAGAVAISGAGSFIYSDHPGQPGLTALSMQTGEGLFAGLLSTFAVALFLLFGVRRRRQYGLRLPRGWRWFLFLPVAVIVGLIGGAWVIPPPISSGGWEGFALAVLFPAVCELLHRGAAHGTLVSTWNIQRTGGSWFLSRPTALMAALSATVSSLFFLPQILAHPAGPTAWITPLWVIGAAALGISCGMARERSGSVLPPILLHIVAALWTVYLPSLA